MTESPRGAELRRWTTSGHIATGAKAVRSVSGRLLMHGLAMRRRVVIARNDARWRSERAALAAEKSSQREQFASLARDLPGVHRALSPWSRDDYVVPDWRANVRALEREFVARPRFDFLRHPTVMATMVILNGGRVLREELEYAEARLPGDTLSRLLEEEFVGGPVLMNGRYRTSHTAIHHVYHLLRFADTTGCDPATLDRTIEWGGGYGSFARVYRRWHGSRPTQVLVDLPIFSLIQWLYLSAVFGPDGVSLVTAPEAPIEAGKISIVPVGLAEAASGGADLFVSTWALSECADPAQRLVVDSSWFGAKHLLLAYQRASSHFPAAARLGQLAECDGASLEPVGVLSGSHYAFR